MLDEICDLYKVDKIILLGDLLHDYYNNDEESTNKTAYLLNKRAKITISILGNTDNKYELSKLVFPVTKEIDKIFLDSNEYFIIHGHNIHKYDYLINNKPYLYGHTHIYNLDGLGINPGSISYPRMGKEHTCILYENNKFYLINIENKQILETKVLI